MTATELITRAQGMYPDRLFAFNRRQSVLGCWSETQARYLPVAALTITGEWHQMLPVLVNGNPLVDESDWITEGGAA